MQRNASSYDARTSERRLLSFSEGGTERYHAPEGQSVHPEHRKEPQNQRIEETERKAEPRVITLDEGNPEHVCSAPNPLAVAPMTHMHLYEISAGATAWVLIHGNWFEMDPASVATGSEASNGFIIDRQKYTDPSHPHKLSVRADQGFTVRIVKPGEEILPRRDAPRFDNVIEAGGSTDEAAAIQAHLNGQAAINGAATLPKTRRELLAYRGFRQMEDRNVTGEVMGRQAYHVVTLIRGEDDTYRYEVRPSDGNRETSHMAQVRMAREADNRKRRAEVQAMTDDKKNAALQNKLGDVPLMEMAQMLRDGDLTLDEKSENYVSLCQEITDGIKELKALARELYPDKTGAETDVIALRKIFDTVTLDGAVGEKTVTETTEQKAYHNGKEFERSVTRVVSVIRYRATGGSPTEEVRVSRVRGYDDPEEAAFREKKVVKATPGTKRDMTVNNVKYRMVAGTGEINVLLQDGTIDENCDAAAELKEAGVRVIFQPNEIHVELLLEKTLCTIEGYREMNSARTAKNVMAEYLNKSMRTGEWLNTIGYRLFRAPGPEGALYRWDPTNPLRIDQCVIGINENGTLRYARYNRMERWPEGVPVPPTSEWLDGSNPPR